MIEPERASARLSVVLATHTYEAIRPVLSALWQQACAHEIEPVIVLPVAARGGVRNDDLGRFRHVQIVILEEVTQLAPARAAGVRAASAPIVFIGETHSYPQPGWAEALLAAFEEPWTAVVPAIGNANPTGAISWAAYLSDYGTWGMNRSAGEMSDPLIYNTAYRRDALLALGNGLPSALDPNEDALWPCLRAAGHRAMFAPRARILHLGVGRLGSLVSEKFCVGVVLGMRRAACWPLLHRILYLLASPVIPIVLLWRVARGARPSWPQKLPAGTIPALVVGAVAKTLGEVVGYLGVRLPSAETHLTDIEVNKVRYASRRAS